MTRVSVAWWFMIFYGGLHAGLKFIADAQTAFGSTVDKGIMICPN